MVVWWGISTACLAHTTLQKGQESSCHWWAARDGGRGHSGVAKPGANYSLGLFNACLVGLQQSLCRLLLLLPPHLHVSCCHVPGSPPPLAPFALWGSQAPPCLPPSTFSPSQHARAKWWGWGEGVGTLHALGELPSLMFLMLLRSDLFLPPALQTTQWLAGRW